MCGKRHWKQMNKQHQLPGFDLQWPTLWHRFHTKSEQIEVDKPVVKTLVLTRLHSTIKPPGKGPANRLVNKESRIMCLGLF